MNDKVKIDVFGISRDPKTGGNAVPLKMYFSLLKYLNSSDVADKVDLHFVDINEPAMANYPAVKSAIQRGTPVPVVSINNSIKYSGSIPYESVYQDVKRMTIKR